MAVAKQATACRCGLSYLQARFSACSNALCVAYAAASIADHSGVPKGTPSEVIEHMQATREALATSIHPVADIAGKKNKREDGGEEGGGGGKALKGKKQIEYLKPEESLIALAESSAMLTGLIAADKPEELVAGALAVQAYVAAFTPDEFQTTLVDNIRGSGEAKDKQFNPSTLRQDLPQMVTFKLLVLQLWDKFNKRPDLLDRRIENAFKTTEASLDLIEKKVSNGTAPAKELKRTGMALLGSFEPKGAITDEARAIPIMLREKNLQNSAEIIQQNWGKDGSKIIDTIELAFHRFARADMESLLAAGHPIRTEDKVALPYSKEQVSFAGLKVKGFLESEALRPETGSVTRALNREKNIELDAAIKYIRATPDVLQRAPQVSRALNNRLILAYIHAANDSLKMATQAISPRIKLRIEELVKAGTLVNNATVMPVVRDYLATPEGSNFSSLQKKHIKAMIKAVRDQYGKQNPEAKKLFVKSFPFDLSGFNAAIKDITEDLVTNSMDKLVNYSDEEIYAYLEDENCFVLAGANGIMAKEYAKYVVDNKTRRSEIVARIRERIEKHKRSGEKAKKVPEKVVKADREKRVKNAEGNTVKRKKTREERTEEDRLKKIVKVEEARLEVETWNSDPTQPPIYLTLKNRLPEQNSQLAKDLLLAYEKVCEDGSGFERFASTSGLSKNTGSGTLVHRIAWNALEVSPIGRERRKKVVEESLKDLSYERIKRDYLSLGMTYSAADKLARSKYVKERKWDSNEEKIAYIVGRIVDAKYTQLSIEAAVELSQKDRELRAGDVKSKVPGVFSSDLTRAILESNKLASERDDSPGDRNALASRALGVKEMKRILKIGEAYLRDLELDVMEVKGDTDKGVISARFAKISATRDSFLADTFEGWLKPPSESVSAKRMGDSSRRAAPAAAGKDKKSTTYPPYLLETELGIATRNLYDKIYDFLSDKYRDTKLLTEDAAQRTIAHEKTEGDARLLDDLSNSEDDDSSWDEKKGDKFAPGKDSSEAGDKGEDEDEDGSDRVGDEDEDYELDDMFVADDEEEEQPSGPISEPSAADFLRNNPKPAFGVSEEYLQAQAKATPVIPVLPPPTPAPSASGDVVMSPAPAIQAPPVVFNMLVPRKKPTSEPLATDPWDIAAGSYSDPTAPIGTTIEEYNI